MTCNRSGSAGLLGVDFFLCVHGDGATGWVVQGPESCRDSHAAPYFIICFLFEYLVVSLPIRLFALPPNMFWFNFVWLYLSFERCEAHRLCGTS